MKNGTFWTAFSNANNKDALALLPLNFKFGNDCIYCNRYRVLLEWHLYIAFVDCSKVIKTDKDTLVRVDCLDWEQ